MGKTTELRLNYADVNISQKTEESFLKVYGKFAAGDNIKEADNFTKQTSRCQWR